MVASSGLVRPRWFRWCFHNGFEWSCASEVLSLVSLWWFRVVLWADCVSMRFKAFQLFPLSSPQGVIPFGWLISWWFCGAFKWFGLFCGVFEWFGVVSMGSCGSDGKPMVGRRLEPSWIRCLWGLVGPMVSRW